MYEKIINWLMNAEEIAILYDFDVDGICSCALMLKIFEHLNKNVLKYAASPRPSFKKNPAIDLVKFYKDLVILDISLNEDNLRLLKKHNVLNIDHHATGIRKDRNNVVVWKNKGKYTPTAKMVYDLGCEMFTDFDKNDWISAVGIISDFGGRFHKRFIKKTLKKYDLCIDGDINFFNTKLGDIGHVINSIRTGGAITQTGIAVKALLECSNPNEFLSGKNAKVRFLYRIHERVGSYIEHELERFREKATRNNNRILFVMKRPKYNIRSTISTILSAKYEETLAIAEERRTDEIHISMRSRKEDLLKIISQLKKEINIIGGGHKKACGLTIKKDDFPIFKRIFLKIK